MVAKFRAQHAEGRHERGKARNTVARLARVKVKRLRRAGLGRREEGMGWVGGRREVGAG